MKIALASDHAGYKVKEGLKALLDELGIEYQDVGTCGEEPVDYPDYARRAAELVSRGICAQAILVCGSGAGMAIVANKLPGVRAIVAWNEEAARLAREHNDANVLALGARLISPAEIERIVRTWFASGFAGGRHATRVRKINEIEAQTSKAQA